MTKDKALKMALDFIERVNKDGWLLADFEPEMYTAITAIKESLKQTDGSSGILLYTFPPQLKEEDNDGRCQDFYSRYCVWDRFLHDDRFY